MRNVSDEVAEKIRTHFTFNNSLFFENRTFYEKIWKNIVQPDRQQTTIWRMPIAFWIPKTTNSHSEYAVLIKLD